MNVEIILIFFRKAIKYNSTLSKVVVDKSGSNKAAFDLLNRELDQAHKIETFQNKYFNNGVEADGSFIKKRITPMLGCKRFPSANITRNRKY